MTKTRRRDTCVKVSLTLPAPLVTRLDRMIEEIRSEHPYRVANRSALVQHLLAEHIALIDDPARARATDITMTDFS